MFEVGGLVHAVDFTFDVCLESLVAVDNLLDHQTTHVVVHVVVAG